MQPGPDSESGESDGSFPKMLGILPGSFDELMAQMPEENASEEEVAAFMKRVMATEEGAKMIQDFADQITQGGRLDQLLQEGDDESFPQSPVRFIFHIELLETGIWRQISLPADASFLNLHEAIQDSFGWMGLEGHEFHIYENGQLELSFSDSEREGHYCEKQNPISQMIENGVQEFEYHYDLKAGWKHLVRLREIVPAGEKGTEKECRPAVHAGEGLCPPEGCGGLAGFQEFLAGEHPLAEEYGAELVRKIRDGTFHPSWVRFR